MLKILSRINRNNQSTHYGKVELRTIEAAPPKLGVTHLIHDHRCIHPIFVNGVSGVCGNPTTGDYGSYGHSHGWLCPSHYLRSMVGDFSSRQQTLDKLDADNISFILEQDRLHITVRDTHNHAEHCPKYEADPMIGGVCMCGKDTCGERLAPFRGWSPSPVRSVGVHDHIELSDED